MTNTTSPITTISTDIFLESWERQSQILLNLAGQVTEPLQNAKSSDDGMEIIQHLCHIHGCRSEWLGTISPAHQARLGSVGQWSKRSDNADNPEQSEQWVFTVTASWEEILQQLVVSSEAIRDAVREAIAEGKMKVGPYDHPVFFLQHMVWHEGYHVGLIMLALRLAGAEPAETWEEQNIWGLWRDAE
jgi:uncharacterized damage-inducible protein DinB